VQRVANVCHLHSLSSFCLAFCHRINNVAENSRLPGNVNDLPMYKFVGVIHGVPFLTTSESILTTENVFASEQVQPRSSL